MKVTRYYGKEKCYQYFNLITKNMDLSPYTDDAEEVFIYPNSHLDTTGRTVWVKDSDDFVICAVDDLLQL
jgi:hypothetical protein